MDIVNVFTNENGEYGNPVGIVIDIGKELSKVDRQKIATDSGLSEVVFINNLEKNEVSLYNPEEEISFAGHALVGAAYFLNQQSKQNITQLCGVKDNVQTWAENGQTWISYSLSLLPDWNFKQLPNAESVETLMNDEVATIEHSFVWAWLNEERGIVRARTFATDWCIPEDEANGSGSMKLASMLNRKLTIIHGKGSIIHARPTSNNCAEVGGLVSLG